MTDSRELADCSFQLESVEIFWFQINPLVYLCIHIEFKWEVWTRASRVASNSSLKSIQKLRSQRKPTTSIEVIMMLTTREPPSHYLTLSTKFIECDGDDEQNKHQRGAKNCSIRWILWCWGVEERVKQLAPKNSFLSAHERMNRQLRLFEHEQWSDIDDDFVEWVVKEAARRWVERRGNEESNREISPKLVIYNERRISSKQKLLTKVFLSFHARTRNVKRILINRGSFRNIFLIIPRLGTRRRQRIAHIEYCWLDVNIEKNYSIHSSSLRKLFCHSCEHNFYLKFLLISSRRLTWYKIS